MTDPRDKDHLTVSEMWRVPEQLSSFETKDSGERVDYPSGMRRDVDTGKPRYDLIPRFMLKRLAELYARGAAKYGEDNYTLADSEEELKRFKASAFRHFIQWLDGERDEDHGAAVFFNIAAAEMTEQKVRANEDLKLLMGVIK
ncbi:MAG TPA: dATP/dGTP diphosphohydrolase domain-containing protein [Acidimicrobiales bacterium]|nr:dATP/dGTP diphosphohydrolase domain-containing protein [Acidimicrobiales bacterium]